MTYNGPWSAEYIEEQYRRWKSDPDAVGKDWQFFFQGFELGLTEKAPEAEAGEVCDEDTVRRQSRVEALIYRYRDIGHLLACLDPLEACPTQHPLLQPDAFGLENADLDRSFYVPGLPSENRIRPLREIIDHLKKTYCHSVGVEYMHLQDPGERKWLRERMESIQNRPEFEADEKKRILRKLIEAAGLEQFIHRKYLGQKRFSVEGADAMVPMLDALINHAAYHNECDQIILGMTHRGRLNVQANILGRSYEEIFRDFEEQYNPEADVGAGDVKYHKGFHGSVTTEHDREIDVIMADNPSHLESVNPVVEGMARARLDIIGIEHTRRVMPVLLHGDAAFAGQGIAAETLNMSQLDGYYTGGTVHIVINNQIGYTALPEDLRSTRYSTDIAKSLMIPIFHVHGEDPEAAVFITKLACDYRMAYGKDVVIDLVCYRRYGHNEGDEPYFTQPLMYERIKDRPSPDVLYAGQLKEEGVVDDKTVKQITDAVQEKVQEAHDRARKEEKPKNDSEKDGSRSEPPLIERLEVNTAVKPKRLKDLARKLNTVPDGFHLHRKLDRLLENRRKAVENGERIDWANAEALAFGTIVEEGVPVRLCGEDTQRGTFSQRHSVLFDTESSDPYVPLHHVSDDQAPFYSINSLLSEAGALGFEYGYSVLRQDGLTIWEAQFGDFINNAQAIVDLYIASGEAKWGCKCGLVLLLPHGYEGQGPDHSSARPERFLQLAAEDNLQVCNPSTPAQYFHLLRRQAVGNILKPLIILTPKSLLRHSLAVSTIGDLTSGGFEPVIDDAESGKSSKTVLFVSGKLYYELYRARQENGAKQTAIIRIEQLYPFPEAAVERLAKRYPSAKTWRWVQEEPSNMGAWRHVAPIFENRLSLPLAYAGRKASASTATGYHHLYKEEQQRLIDEAFET